VQRISPKGSLRCIWRLFGARATVSTLRGEIWTENEGRVE
jgi:hypothetical protein